MTPVTRFVPLAVACLLGCRDAPPPPPDEPAELPRLADAMPNIPLPPGAKLVSRSGSADAIQITLRSDLDAARVADYYRGVLTRDHWRLLSDVKGRDGVVTLYAEQDGPPLWVRVWADSGASGSMVELAGAVVAKEGAGDSAKGDSAKGGKARQPAGGPYSDRS